MHTLANYLRQTGALVTTIRFGFQEEELARLKPDLLVLSPGPGNPKDFDLSRTIDIALRRKLPVVGVCLGLQACALTLTLPPILTLTPTLTLTLTLTHPQPQSSLSLAKRTQRLVSC